jgi:ABC-type lipoprotein export system ATPase subunit
MIIGKCGAGKTLLLLNLIKCIQLFKLDYDIVQINSADLSNKYYN